jgi:hypothetical protein
MHIIIMHVLPSGFEVIHRDLSFHLFLFPLFFTQMRFSLGSEFMYAAVSIKMNTITLKIIFLTTCFTTGLNDLRPHKLLNFTDIRPTNLINKFVCRKIMFEESV